MTKILALELSTARGSIAWLEDDGEVSIRTFANNRKHSGLFFENLQCYQREFGPPNIIIVGLGPGSYAGIRIGIATALGLRAASASKLFGIPSICAMEIAAREYQVIGDARRASFFFGRLVDDRLIEGPSLYSGTEVKRKLQESNVQICASEPLPEFPQAILAYPSAGKLAILARNRPEELANSDLLEPIYLREPHITKPKTSRAVIHQ